MRKTFTLLFALLYLSLYSFGQNRGLHFDGVNDVVSIPEKAGMLTTSTFTVETWVKPTGSFPSTHYLLRKTNDGYSTGLEIYFYNGGNGILAADLYKSGMGAGITYNLPVSWTNQWHHIAVTNNGSSMVLYVDGVQVGTTSVSGMVQTTNSSPIHIGAYTATGSFPFPGEMDELRFWNAALSQTQIQSNRNREIAAATTNLAAYYRFNQGTVGGNNTSITSVTDQVASHSGALLNFARTGATSNFTAGYGTIAVLAVKEGSFSASKRGSVVQLDWKADDENTSLFIVERSENGTDFSKIGVVANSISGLEKNYAFTDMSPLPKNNYYRIKTTDATGRTTYSKTLAVAMNKAVAGMSVFPNPASSTIQLQFTAPKGINLVELKDMTGRTLQSIQVASQGTILYHTLDINRLPKGVYVISVQGETRSFIKQ